MSGRTYFLMEVERKRKREDNEEASAKREKPRGDDDGVAPALPGDEEVDEFFAILKRIQVAVKYFRRRNGVRCPDSDVTGKSLWRPSFEREDFEGVERESEENPNGILDLNSDPASDESHRV